MIDDNIDPLAEPQQENPFAVPELTGEETQVAGRMDAIKEILRGAEEARRTREAPTLGFQTTDDVPVAEVKTAEATAAVTGKPPETIFNLDKIDDTDSFKAHIDAVATTFDAGNIEKMSYRQLATDMSANGYSEKFVADVINPNVKLKSDPAEVYKMMLVLTDAGKRTEKLAMELDAAARAGTDTAEMLIEFRQAMAYEGLISKGVKKKQADVARSLGVLSQARKADADRGFRLDEIIRASGGRENTVGLARAYISAGGKEKSLRLAEDVASYSPLGRIKDIWFSTWINGLLSSPVTHIKNMGANTIFAGWKGGEKIIASGIGHIRHALNGSEDYIRGQELLVDAFSSKQAIQEAMTLSIEAFKQNKQLTGVSKLELQPINDPFNIPLSENAGAVERMSKRAFGYWGKGVTLPGRALMAEDEFFKAFHYRKHLNSLAYRKSTQEYNELIKQGIDPVDAEKMSEDIASEILSGRNQAAHEEAMSFAAEMTFTKPLEGKLKAVEKVVQHPLAKMYVPFIRTPTNIAIELNKRLPTTFMSKQTRADWAAGGAKRDLVLAKAGMGSMFLTGIGSMALDGHITGAGPLSLDERQAMQSQGWQPYSFVFDDSKLSKESMDKLATLGGNISKYDGKVYVSYAGYEPVGALLGIGASMGEYSVMEPDATAYEKFFNGGVLASMDYMSNLPMVQGVSEITNVFRSGAADENDRVDMLVKRIAGQAAEFGIGGSPMGAYSSMLAYTNRIFNGEKKDPRTSYEGYADLDPASRAFLDSLNQYYSRNPFTSSKTKNQRDTITGEIKHYPVPEAWMRSLPVSVSKGRYSPAHGILQLYGLGQYKPSKKVDGVELNAEQYQRMIELATAPDEYGYTLEDRIMEQFNDQAFQEFSVERPMEARSSIQAIISDSYARARSVMFGTDEDVGEFPNLSVTRDIKKAGKEAKIIERIEGIRP